MKTKNIMLVASILGAFACAHSDTRTEGVVVDKLGPNEAKVHMRHVQLSAGDKVVLSKDMCVLKPVTGDSPTEVPLCDKVKIGEGQIVRILNKHESVVRVASGVALEVGTVIEKI